MNWKWHILATVASLIAGCVVEAADKPLPPAATCNRSRLGCYCGDSCKCDAGKCPLLCPVRVAQPYRGERSKPGHYLYRDAQGWHWWIPDDCNAKEAPAAPPKPAGGVVPHGISPAPWWLQCSGGT